MVDHVISEVADGVQAIRFDRIEAQNALTAAMCDAVADAVAFGESSSRVRAIMLAGAPGIFTVGHDRTDIAAFAEGGVIGASVLRLLKTLAMVDKPLVAAVDGPVFGFGTTILFFCDYVVASEWSSFAAPFADIGLPPDAGASLLAPRLMGHHRAFALLVLGEPFDAQQARESGLVNRVVAAEDVDRAARAVTLALASKPPEAVRMGRRLLRGDRRDVLARIDQEAATFVELLKSPAARDALQAWLEGKNP
jgi:enoyl-CoA hydratase/carnithine racemase